jgi:molybdate transport repressor ModE-like protein
MLSEPHAGARHERLPGVELRHLAALRAIAEEGSFRGAADALGYVQSAVSHQVAALERLVGTRLVERSRGNAPVSLTRAGTLLLEHADDILARFDVVHAKLTALVEERSGTVRVGAFQSVAVNVLPRVMAELARTDPAFRVLPTETQSDVPLMDMVLEGELDLAFCEALDEEDDRFDSMALTHDPFVLLMSENSPLAASEEAPALKDLGRFPLIALTESRAQERMLEALRLHGVEPTFAFRADLNPTLQALVAADIGVAIVPYLTVDPTHPTTTVVELPELPARTISLIWPRGDGLTPATSRFIEVAQAVCPRFRQTPSAIAA